MEKTTKPTDFRAIWLGMPRKERDALAKKLDTSYPYLQRLSGGFACPSLAFAVRVKELIPSLDVASFGRATKLAGKRMTMGIAGRP